MSWRHLHGRADVDIIDPKPFAIFLREVYSTLFDKGAYLWEEVALGKSVLLAMM